MCGSILVRKELLRNNRLILASASPRRQALLQELIADFDVQPSEIREPTEKPRSVSARAWTEALAYLKAAAVAERNREVWVLGADTIVVCGGELLGKPRDRLDAERMLRLQAGRPSEVITGLCLAMRSRQPDRVFGSALTRVWMRADEIAIGDYLESGDWAGKAGAYGVQDIGDRLVERYEGSFSNVVGLPLELTATLLRRLALDR